MNRNIDYIVVKRSTFLIIRKYILGMSRLEVSVGTGLCEATIKRSERLQQGIHNSTLVRLLHFYSEELQKSTIGGLHYHVR